MADTATHLGAETLLGLLERALPVLDLLGRDATPAGWFARETAADIRAHLETPAATTPGGPPWTA